VTHRAESIAAAVQALVTNLTTTGARVDRGRADNIDSTKCPALRVYVGEDRVVDPWAHALLDSDLEVNVDAHVHTSAANVETLLHLIRSEVTVALLADYTLGLAYVHSIVEVGAGRPALEGEMAKPAGKLEMHFVVRYRRSRTNPDA
jgi:hypothetical protein